jgi:hypothetical protein
VNFFKKMVVKSIFLVLVFCCVCTINAFAKGKLLQKIGELERVRYNLMVQADTAALGKLIHNNCQYYHSNGMLDTKQKLLQSIATKELVHKNIVVTDAYYRFFKSTAIVTGKATYDIVWKGEPMLLIFAFTNVYAKVKGKWLLVNRNTVKLR